MKKVTIAVTVGFVMGAILGFMFTHTPSAQAGYTSKFEDPQHGVVCYTIGSANGISCIKVR